MRMILSTQKKIFHFCTSLPPSLSPSFPDPSLTASVQVYPPWSQYWTLTSLQTHPPSEKNFATHTQHYTHHTFEASNCFFDQYFICCDIKTRYPPQSVHSNRTMRIAIQPTISKLTLNKLSCLVIKKPAIKQLTSLLSTPHHQTLVHRHFCPSMAFAFNLYSTKVKKYGKASSRNLVCLCFIGKASSISPPHSHCTHLHGLSPGVFGSDPQGARELGVGGDYGLPVVRVEEAVVGRAREQRPVRTAAARRVRHEVDHRHSSNRQQGRTQIWSTKVWVGVSTVLKPLPNQRHSSPSSSSSSLSIARTHSERLKSYEHKNKSR